MVCRSSGVMVLLGHIASMGPTLSHRLVVWCMITGLSFADEVVQMPLESKEINLAEQIMLESGHNVNIVQRK